MEKKGEILNQLAIISDLLENINLIAESKSVIIIVSKNEYYKISKIVEKKTKSKLNRNEKFSIKIGDIDFIFSMNNV